MIFYCENVLVLTSQNTKQHYLFRVLRRTERLA